MSPEHPPNSEPLQEPLSSRSRRDGLNSGTSRCRDAQGARFKNCGISGSNYFTKTMVQLMYLENSNRHGYEIGHMPRTKMGPLFFWSPPRFFWPPPYSFWPPTMFFWPPYLVFYWPRGSAFRSPMKSIEFLGMAIILFTRQVCFFFGSRSSRTSQRFCWSNFFWLRLQELYSPWMAWMAGSMKVRCVSGSSRGFSSKLLGFMGSEKHHEMVHGDTRILIQLMYLENSEADMCRDG